MVEINLTFDTETVTEDELVSSINSAFDKSKNVNVYFYKNNGNKVLNINIQKIISRAGSILHFILWQIITLNISNVEYSSDDNNVIILQPRFGHNVKFKSSFINPSTWNFVSGVGYTIQ